jgi:hypothetical protein
VTRALEADPMLDMQALPALVEAVLVVATARAGAAARTQQKKHVHVVQALERRWSIWTEAGHHHSCHHSCTYWGMQGAAPGSGWLGPGPGLKGGSAPATLLARFLGGEVLLPARSPCGHNHHCQTIDCTVKGPGEQAR